MPGVAVCVEPTLLSPETVGFVETVALLVTGPADFVKTVVGRFAELLARTLAMRCLPASASATVYEAEVPDVAEQSPGRVTGGLA